MKTSDFDYELPAELIAQQPLADRTASRMMVVDRRQGTIDHDQFRNIGHYLRTGDLLVLNDTKVIPARIWSREPPLELLLVENLGNNRWSALVKPAKKAKPGAVLKFVGAVSDGDPVARFPVLTAVVEDRTDFGGRVLRFEGDLEGYLQRFGAAPLPPYIKRARRDLSDIERYQTVFATRPGAVAAPTAGLHFTTDTLDQLQQAGVGHAFITLHVGLGTFRPVKLDNVEEHKMHAERFSISSQTAAVIRGARAASRRIVAVGTTTVRALETVGEPSASEGSTEIFIRPPFQFSMVNALLTNFHLPRSTLLMLVCAFASQELMLRAYSEAVRKEYRFFSYGDCMLIL